MKSYDELKAEMEAIQLQMLKRRRTNVLTHSKKSSVFAKSLALLLGCLKVHLLKKRNRDEEHGSSVGL